MIERHFSLQKPYRYIRYRRMSDPQQNSRSPEQQTASIEEVKKRLGCPWILVGEYTDRYIKGRYVRRRPDFQRLMRDIAAGLIQIDLIVVDTFERFGRTNELEAIRHKLGNYGVFIVSANNHFADPTGLVGKTVTMVDQIRSTEENRVKSHQVTRGKKDALRQGHWPGGPVPFGFKLKKCIDESGREPVIYSILEEDTITGPIMRRIFKKAHETAWGGTRLAQFFNADSTIPDEFKPFYACTIDMWLRSEVYIGIGIWGEVNTDIVNDSRVIEPNPHPEEIVRVENFCPPLVGKEVFADIKAVIAGRKRPKKPAAPGQEKIIKAISPGLSVRYFLSGITHCDDCGACMVPRSSGRKSKAGQEYCYYVCPRHNDGSCKNSRHIRVDDLQPAVISALRKNLFPPQTESVPEWFAPLVQRVESRLDRLREDHPRRSRELEREIEQMEQQLSGWKMSLGKLDLAAALRQDLERSYEQTLEAKARKEAEMASEQVRDQQLRQVLDPQQVLDALKRLDEVMTQANPTLINLELCKHIVSIDVRRDGQVVLRGTWLGLFNGAVELLCATPVLPVTPAEPKPPTPFGRVRPRRLARRHVDDLSQDTSSANDGGESVDPLDPHRYDGLEGFVWEEILLLPERIPWVRQNAAAVLKYRRENPKVSLGAIAKHFGKSRPTISTALRIAEEEERKNKERQKGEEPDPKKSDEESPPEAA